MSKIKPIVREVKQAVLDGMAHSKDKLPELTSNMHRHIDDVVKKVKGNDRFDAPDGSTPNSNRPDTDTGPRRDERGRYAPNPDRDVDTTYDRPSGWRAGMRDTTWNDAAVDGVVRDPVTGDVLDPNEPWVMGHDAGYEFRHHQRSAQERGISREQFLDEYYNDTRYRPESPHTSSSGTHELDWEQYIGPGSPFV